jgi:hypothetical protein
VLNPSVYVGGAWSLLGVGAVPGHTADSDVSGIGPLEGGLYGFYAGTGNSVAIKRKIASLVAKGSLPSAFELIRYNGADPRTGAAPWFASPARHGGSQAPVPIVEDIDRVMTDIRRDGNGGFVRFSTYAEALTYWSMSRPSTYVIPKTGE